LEEAVDLSSDRLLMNESGRGVGLNNLHHLTARLKKE
jgi:hypothetical protein